MTKTEIKEVDVRRCARCGEDHQGLPFVEFHQAMTLEIGRRSRVYSHWAQCPTTKDPIVMRVFDDSRDYADPLSIFEEIEHECDRQTEMWGPAHDDEHSWRDWGMLITRYVVKADVALIEERDAAEWRGRLVQAAAIIVSALRSFDRRSS